MFGKTHEMSTNCLPVSETPTRTVESLEIDLENALEEVEKLTRASLRPLALKYEKELKAFLYDMNQAHYIHKGSSVKNVLMFDDDISTLTNFINELLQGAHEVL